MPHPHIEHPNYKCIKMWEDWYINGDWEKVYYKIIYPKIKGPAQMAEDIAHEVWARTYRALLHRPSAVWRGGGAKPEAWLILIARTEANKVVLSWQVKHDNLYHPSRVDAPDPTPG